ncbi:pupal cuticle protein C1B-like [Cylas formicarius]|uniref:pupal cuticle protein C1B-like n=1 Tax=Cylas formicarius TaxID=197179 RepID=UPI00295863DB|nr:pupal cuticle protein C1B-like [Cylas formicarius]
MKMVVRFIIALAVLSTASGQHPNSASPPPTRTASLLGVAYSAAADVSHVAFKSPLLSYGSLADIHLPAEPLIVKNTISQHDDIHTDVTTDIGYRSPTQDDPQQATLVRVSNPGFRYVNNVPAQYTQPVTSTGNQVAEESSPVAARYPANPAVHRVAFQGVTNYNYGF